MKSSRVLMHIDLRCMDIMALTHKKNFSTCLNDSPFFLKVSRLRDFLKSQINSNLGTREAQALRCLTNTMATSGSHLFNKTVLASSH